MKVTLAELNSFNDDVEVCFNLFNYNSQFNLETAIILL